MDMIKQLAELDYVLIILGFFAILFAVKEIIEIFTYFKKKFRIKLGSEEDKESVENRLFTLEKHDNWQYKEIVKIAKGIDEIKDKLDVNEKETKQRIIVQYGADLYNLHSKFMASRLES